MHKVTDTFWNRWCKFSVFRRCKHSRWPHV